jgi:hypothetical protein
MRAVPLQTARRSAPGQAHPRDATQDSCSAFPADSLPVEPTAHVVLGQT